MCTYFGWSLTALLSLSRLWGLFCHLSFFRLRLSFGCVNLNGPILLFLFLPLLFVWYLQHCTRDHRAKLIKATYSGKTGKGIEIENMGFKPCCQEGCHLVRLCSF